MISRNLVNGASPGEDTTPAFPVYLQKQLNSHAATRLLVAVRKLKMKRWARRGCSRLRARPGAQSPRVPEGRSSERACGFRFRFDKTRVTRSWHHPATCAASQKTLMMPRYAKSKWSTWRLAARSWPLINSTGNAPRPDAAPTGLQKIFTPFCMGGPIFRSFARPTMRRQARIQNREHANVSMR